MEKEKIIALLNEVLNENSNNGVCIKVKNEGTVEVDGAVYKVLTDEEADEEFFDYQENLIDDVGLDAFAKWAQEYILENFVDIDWFNEYQEEFYENYINDIREEYSSQEEYSTRLVEEMSEADCKDEEEFLEYLCEDYDDSIKWYIDNFGEKDFKILVTEKELIDWESVINWTKREDGRGCLAYYDSCELELENDFYAYRIE